MHRTSHIHAAFLTVLLVQLFATDAFAQRNRKPADAATLFSKDNLVAWCIVPFDAKKRSPEQRALMLAELGLSRCAYDWRAEHVTSFEQEILAYQKHGIELFAFWGEHPQAFELFIKYDLHPQIWKMLKQPDAQTQQQKVEQSVASLVQFAKQTQKMNCKLGIYNHGGWSGEPLNMIAVCNGLQEMGFDHVGIVYNFHHGHEHISDWENSLQLMLPHLLCINLNGMNSQPDPKILGIGKGDHELQMIQAIVDSGYSGPFGILDHRNELDARESLLENLKGLNSVSNRLKHQ